MQLLVRRVALSMLFISNLIVCWPLHGQTQDLEELLEGARAAQSTGSYAEAAELYGRATSLSPKTPELWSNRGVMEFLAGKVDASIPDLEHALRLNPTLFAPLLFLGKAYIQSGKPSQALPYLDHAHALQPNDAETLLALGRANMDLNRQREAASFYADATRFAPDNAEAWLGLGSSSLGVITTDGRNLAASAAQSTWARALYADELLTQDRPLEATDTYKAALAKASPAQKATLARNLEWMQSHPALFPLQPNSQEALQRLSVQLVAEKSDVGLPSCAAADRQRQPALSSLVGAACAYWAGDYAHAATRSWQVLRHSPQNAEALYWSVKANERLAVAALLRFEELAPGRATTYDMVGDLYRDQREPDSAISEYKKALAIDAHDPAALMGAALAYQSEGKSEEAAEITQAALADRPLDPQLNLLMAEALGARKLYDQAKPYLAKCLDAPPELQSRVHLLLGRADSEDGETEEAIRQFEMALPGDEDGRIHYQLARLYRKTGNIAQAQKAEAGAIALIERRRAKAVIALREAVGTNP